MNCENFIGIVLIEKPVACEENSDLETLTADNSVTDDLATLGFEPWKAMGNVYEPMEFHVDACTTSGEKKRSKMKLSNSHTGSGRGHIDFRFEPKCRGVRCAPPFRISGRCRQRRRDGDDFRDRFPTPPSHGVDFENQRSR